MVQSNPKVDQLMESIGWISQMMPMKMKIEREIWKV
jgi:hypothetical protein